MASDSTESSPRPEDAYADYRKGLELLEDGDYAAAREFLERAAESDPDKSSVREALGRAYFRLHDFRGAVEEFAAVVERHPVNDFAHFCLGRALSKVGDNEGARHHLALAANLRPERRDYRTYRERLARAS
jgi:tetratricopeptide (TPR) repeat protein